MTKVLFTFPPGDDAVGRASLDASALEFPASTTMNQSISAYYKLLSLCYSIYSSTKWTKILENTFVKSPFIKLSWITLICACQVLVTETVTDIVTFLFLSPLSSLQYLTFFLFQSFSSLGYCDSVLYFLPNSLISSKSPVLGPFLLFSFKTLKYTVVHSWISSITYVINRECRTPICLHDIIQSCDILITSVCW